MRMGEAVILALSCSADAFAAGFAYGGKGITIPLLSNQIINLICGAVLGLSLWLGALVRPFLPARAAAVVCFVILFTLGVFKLLDSVTKSVIRRHGKGESLNFNFVLSLCADPEKADVDENKIISPAEAAALSLALSLDGLAVGFGAGVGSVNVLVAVFTSLLANMAAVASGCGMGRRLSKALPFNVSWVGGAVLIGLAVSKLL